MITIYGIEDINDNTYVGSTIQKLNQRLTEHRADKRNNRYCSSSKLNLDYCIIYELEKCEEKDRKEREQYWIDKLDCVNERKSSSFNYKQHNKDYYKKHKQEIKIKDKQRYQKNKEEIYKKQQEYRKNNKEKIEEYNKQYAKEYYRKNKEKIREQHRQYYLKKKSKQ